MRLIAALLQLVLLICPFALCYGQLSFSSVNGERGYAAMRGYITWDLDNGFILRPSGGFYRISDKEEDQTGATAKAALDVIYELNDTWELFVGSFYIPRRLGFKNYGYHVGAQHSLCYHCGPFKNPYLRVEGGQSFYDLTEYSSGERYDGHFRTTAPKAAAEVGSELGKFFVQARFDKVIKYSHRPPTGIVSNWTEIPFMTAVVQGFIRDVLAVRLAYQTPWITPYVAYARYQYMEQKDETLSLAGGLSLHWGPSTFSGGVEVFEQNRHENRKTYFSISASTQF